MTGRTATFTYHDNGALDAVAWSGGGARREYTVDDLSRVTTDEWLRPDDTVAAATGYTYDDDDDLVATSVVDRTR